MDAVSNGVSRSGFKARWETGMIHCDRQQEVYRRVEETCVSRLGRTMLASS